MSTRKFKIAYMVCMCGSHCDSFGQEFLSGCGKRQVRERASYYNLPMSRKKHQGEGSQSSVWLKTG